MIKLQRSMTHRWIIDKNVNSKDILSEFASIIKDENNGFSFNEVIDKAYDRGAYKGRSTSGSTITVGVRLLQACYYMFGYSFNTQDKKKVFMPTPMTMNILSTDNPNKQAENYLVNLFGIQYPNPFNRTPEDFQIYVGRLFVKLLLDERIDKKLYIDECIWFLPFIEKCTLQIYEDLVKSIIEFRNLSYLEKKQLFESIPNYEYLFANVTHEMNYYFIRLFKDFGVFDVFDDSEHNNGCLFRFRHGKGDTFRNDAWKTKKNCSGYIKLSTTVLKAAKKLNDKFSAFDIPTKESDDNIFTRRDWLINIYEIEPLSYLSCINTEINRRNEVSNIINAMVYASKFGSRDGKEFENALEPFMNLFRETRNVEILSGAGNTDLLCTMEKSQTKLSPNRFYKMNVEAKTRCRALEDVNPARITRHINKHGAKFCVIVAPKFARGVMNDIQYSQIVTIRSEDIAAYCYRECIESADGCADFDAIYNIIIDNMGQDITDNVRELIANKYGITCTSI